MQNTKSPSIGKDVDISELYNQHFKDLQHSSCKVITKVFVKAIKPKKQTKHLYTRGSEKAPSWCLPRLPQGKKATAKHGFVGYKGPDHLMIIGKNLSRYLR